MPMPWSYRHSEKEFKSFLKDAKDRMGHVMESDNMAYTAIDGVLQVFRRRLSPPEVIAFGDVLPSTLRAILVYNWKVDAVPVPWGTRSELVREIMAVRKEHNLTPLNVIDAVAYALWRHCNHRDLRRVLDQIGPEAVAFWAVSGVSEAELEQQMV